MCSCFRLMIRTFFICHRKKESGLRRGQSFCLDGAMLTEPHVRAVTANESTNTAPNDERFLLPSYSFEYHCARRLDYK